MRLIALAALALTGCSVKMHPLAQPTVAGRFDSAKSAEAFAKCAAEALPNWRLSQKGVAWTLLLKEGIVEKARWDFFPANAGSQAELRSGAREAGGSRLCGGVFRGCEV